MLYDPKWQPKTDTETKAILIKARRLIGREEQWCQSYERGVSICAIHAIHRATERHPNFESAEDRAVTALGRGMGLPNPGTGVMEGRWNDSHTHAEVLAAFDRAIAIA